MNLVSSIHKKNTLAGSKSTPTYQKCVFLSYGILGFMCQNIGESQITHSNMHALCNRICILYLYSVSNRIFMQNFECIYQGSKTLLICCYEAPIAMYVKFCATK